MDQIIPDGYEIIGYREPAIGDTFLTKQGSVMNDQYVPWWRLAEERKRHSSFALRMSILTGVLFLGNLYQLAHRFGWM